MFTTADAMPASLDYDRRTATYARHRTINPKVVRALIVGAPITASTDILDVGCGTGNYAAALVAATGCRVSGIDPSREMLARAREAAPWQSLVQGRAESLPFPDNSFDLVMTTDVIHHIRDRHAHFREAMRVLRPGGRIVAVTDSHDDIRRRRPLSSHFPETVEVELRRYPPLSALFREMDEAGFTDRRTVQVVYDYELDNIDAYRERAFSSLLLIDDEAFARGISRLTADLAHGPILCRSLYTLIWGTRPAD
jgi:ubiquinone/menaquinone biosynthesis C-methylase UbiE